MCATVWRRAAIAVLPSTYGEGVPKALLEAAACARPMVASDMPGCREVVRHGETGLLVPPRDVDGAGRGDRRARRRSGAAAGDGAGRPRALVEREFAERVIAEQTLALYRAALCRKRGAAR